MLISPMLAKEVCAAPLTPGVGDRCRHGVCAQRDVQAHHHQHPGRLGTWRCPGARHPHPRGGICVLLHAHVAQCPPSLRPEGQVNHMLCRRGSRRPRGWRRWHAVLRATMRAVMYSSPAGWHPGGGGDVGRIAAVAAIRAAVTPVYQTAVLGRVFAAHAVVPDAPPFQYTLYG